MIHIRNKTQRSVLSEFSKFCMEKNSAARAVTDSLLLKAGIFFFFNCLVKVCCKQMCNGLS